MFLIQKKTNQYDLISVCYCAATVRDSAWPDMAGAKHNEATTVLSLSEMD